jgi:hypothetical protein
MPKVEAVRADRTLLGGCSMRLTPQYRDRGSERRRNVAPSTPILVARRLGGADGFHLAVGEGRGTMTIPLHDAFEHSVG